MDMHEAADYFKMKCPKCGQPIECPFEGYDQLVECPNCHEQILARPEVKKHAGSPPSKLRKCPDCATDVSWKAESCPKCGCVLKQKKSIFYYVFIGTLCLLATIAIIWVGMLVLGGVLVTTAVSNYNEGKATATATKTTPKLQPLTEEENYRAKNLFQTANADTDDFTGVTFYSFKPESTYKNYTTIYIGRKGKGKPWLRLKIDYSGDDWLFIKSYAIKADGVVFNLVPELGEIERDNSSGTVWETLDVGANGHKSAVDALVSASTVVIRHDGERGVEDRTLSDDEMQWIKNTFLVYRYLGGEW